jgi:hypothetical protein
VNAKYRESDSFCQTKRVPRYFSSIYNFNDLFSLPAGFFT